MFWLGQISGIFFMLDNLLNRFNGIYKKENCVIFFAHRRSEDKKAILFPDKLHLYVRAVTANGLINGSVLHNYSFVSC
jgi:hypothetical protein